MTFSDEQSTGKSATGPWMVRVSAACVIFVGWLVLAGWQWDVSILRSLGNEWVSMKVNTALAFVACGAALLLLPDASSRTMWVIRAAALLVVTTAGLTLAQYLFAFDAGIDQALFPDQAVPLKSSHPGRMAPSTALCFLLTGFALFSATRLSPSRLRYPLIKSLGTAVTLIGFFSLAGYAADTAMGSRWWAYTGMAAHTAGCFILLGGGILAHAGTREPYTRFLEVTTSAGFLSGILLMFLAAQLAFRQTGQLLETSDWVTHRQEILKEVGEWESALAALESSQRGFLITGDEGHLAARPSAMESISESHGRIYTLTADSTRQRQRLTELASLTELRVRWEIHTINARREVGAEAAALLVSEGRGVELRSQLHRILQEMNGEEYRLLENDKARAESAATATFLLLPLGVFLSLSILLGGMFFLNAGLGDRAAAEAQLRESYEKHAREMARINRLYSALSHVNQSIVRQHDRNALFQEVCRILCEHGGLRLAWIGMRDPGSERISPVADWGDAGGYLKSIEVFADDRPKGRGPTGTAFRTEQPYICNDFFQDPITLPWRSQAEQQGFRASAAFPIRKGGNVCGILTVHAGEIDFFQDEEIALLTEAADDVSFAIDNLAREEERRLAEELAEKERHFSGTMIESMPGIVYFYTEEGRFLRWNRNFSAVSGYTSGEITRMHPLDFFSEVEKPLIAAKIAEVFATGASFAEASLTTKTGESIPYFFTGKRLVFGGENCLVGVGIDVTERHRAEEALRKSEERYRSTLDGMMEGCQLLDFDWRYLYANDAATAHNRRPASEMLGRSMREVWPGIEATEVHAMLRRCMTERRALHMETEFTFPDGGSGWFDVQGQPSPEGIAVLSIDITERKLAQAELLALNAGLEARVAERTVELQALNAELESFCYSVSHDLRAPLRGIAGFTQLLEEGCGDALDETNRDYFRRILSATNRMGELIDDLLKLSRVTREELRPREIDLSGLGRTVADELRAATPDRATEILISDGLAARGDPRLLRIVLENLLGNAWKFTAKTSSPRIEFGARNEGRERVFFVRDNGAGFEMQYAGKLFAPFQRLHRVAEYPGTGIGLATVQRIIHRHGGRVWAEAETGRGATFFFTLPEPRTS